MTPHVSNVEAKRVAEVYSCGAAAVGCLSTNRERSLGRPLKRLIRAGESVF
jgi:hypothetical protein